MRDKHGHKLVLKVCQTCGQEKWMIPTSVSCSRSCNGKKGFKAMLSSLGITDRKKEHNPNWKGGTSTDWSARAKREKELNPEKVRARSITAKARRDGRLKKQPCEICGSTERIESHHDDYSKPLEVRWLCKKHHNEITWGKQTVTG